VLVEADEKLAGRRNSSTCSPGCTERARDPLRIAAELERRRHA
jgi:hypothetical protein